MRIPRINCLHYTSNGDCLKSKRRFILGYKACSELFNYGNVCPMREPHTGPSDLPPPPPPLRTVKETWPWAAQGPIPLQVIHGGEQMKGYDVVGPPSLCCTCDHFKPAHSYSSIGEPERRYDECHCPEVRYTDFVHGRKDPCVINKEGKCRHHSQYTIKEKEE